MRDLLFSFIFLSSCVIFTEAAVGYGIVPKHEDYPDKCYDPDRDLLISPDQPVTVEGCIELSCSIEGEKYIISMMSCGAYGFPSNCVGVSDDTKDYPDCCPQPVCNGEYEDK